jgi:hypothetical protein
VTTTEILSTVVAVAQNGSMAMQTANGHDNRRGRAAGRRLNPEMEQRKVVVFLRERSRGQV